MPDGMLAHLRDTYPIEIVWAPRWAGDELRQARTGVESALAPEKELARMDEQIANLAAEHSSPASLPNANAASHSPPNATLRQAPTDLEAAD